MRPLIQSLNDEIRANISGEPRAQAIPHETAPITWLFWTRGPPESPMHILSIWEFKIISRNQLLHRILPNVDWRSCANCAFEDSQSVGACETAAAILIWDDSDGCKLKLNSCWSWVSGLSPSWSDGSTTTNESWSEINCTNWGCKSNRSSGSDDRNVVNQSDWWVAFVVDNEIDSVSRSSIYSVMSSCNDNHVAAVSINCAMSSASNPTVVDDKTSAEIF